MNTALRAGPIAHGQRKLRQFEAAARAAFRGREESVDSDKMLSGHFALVLAHTHELAPAGIGYRLCQMVVLQHVLNLQALKDQRLVFVHHSVRGLMLEVAALTGHTPVQFRQTLSRFFAVAASLLFSRKRLLRLLQFLLRNCAKINLTF